MSQQKKRVLILGGGFGGIKAALELSVFPFFEVTLISDQDSFRYYPQLYKAATGGDHSASQIPLAEMFEAKNIRVVKDSVHQMDRVAKTVEGTSGRKYPYDTLVVALGVVTNFFGIEGLKEYAYGIKTFEESRRLREHLHQQLIEDQKPDINYVVVGGGLTGVELAGALPGYLRHIIKNHRLGNQRLRIDLIEAKGRLLPSMPKGYSKAVARRLRKLGVKLYLNQEVKAETAKKLKVGSRTIDSQTVVWTAGVTNHPFMKASGFALSEEGKAVVDDYLRAAEDIFVIGDNAETKYSGLAQTALYDGRFVAVNLKRLAGGKQMKPYEPKRPIYVTPVGPYWAAVLWGRVRFYGWLGWLVRSLADFMGYQSIEPWAKASKHWQATFSTEETCLLCAPRKETNPDQVF